MRIPFFRVLCLSSLSVAAPAMAAQQAPGESRVVFWGLQGDCSGTLASAFSEELGSLLMPVERPSALPNEQKLRCQPGECAEHMRALPGVTPESLKGTYLLGGQVDEQESVVRYRLWIYSFDRREAVSAAKWMPSRTPQSLSQDMARSARTLLQDFNRLCCSTGEQLKEVSLSECLPSFHSEVRRVSRRRGALLLAYNDSAMPADKQKQELSRFSSSPAFRAMRNLGELQIDGYSGDPSAILSSDSQKEAELRQRRKEYLIELRWVGANYQVQLCQRPREGTSTLNCRQHPRLVEDNASDEALAKDLSSRVSDLYSYSSVPPAERGKLCAPFDATQCLSGGKIGIGGTTVASQGRFGPLIGDSARPAESPPIAPAPVLSPAPSGGTSSKVEASLLPKVMPPITIRAPVAARQSRVWNNLLWSLSGVGVAATANLGALAWLGPMPGSSDKNPYVSGAIAASVFSVLSLSLSIGYEAKHRPAKEQAAPIPTPTSSTPTLPTPAPPAP